MSGPTPALAISCTVAVAMSPPVGVVVSSPQPIVVVPTAAATTRAGIATRIILTNFFILLSPPFLKDIRFESWTVDSRVAAIHPIDGGGCWQVFCDAPCCRSQWRRQVRSTTLQRRGRLGPGRRQPHHRRRRQRRAGHGGTRRNHATTARDAEGRRTGAGAGTTLPGGTDRRRHAFRARRLRGSAGHARARVLRCARRGRPARRRMGRALLDGRGGSDPARGECV